MIVPHRLRAPQGDGSLLAEPPLTEVGRLLEENRRRLAGAPGDLLGRPWADVRAEARRTAAAAARAYLRQAGEPLPPDERAALLMAAHQPELFHPGVWVKNFALNHLARLQGLTPLNLVVDNDTIKSTAVKIPHPIQDHHPVSSPGHPPQAAPVPFDRWAAEVPYEERPVLDEAEFADFPGRAAEVTRAWGFEPLLPAFWAEVLRQARRTTLVGERFAAARRAFERDWGCHNLEVPVSALCRTEPFAWFVLHLLAHLPRFHATYNACLKDYRRAYGLRSRSHPVPDLAAEGDWLEVPLWGWRSDHPRRGRLMARLSPNRVELRAGGETWPALPPPTASGQAVAALLDLECQGYRLRSRALTNTLYCRWFLSDLFIHGIGGGKYDELTDAIARQFYGLEPPAYLVLSGTLHLPLRPFPVRPGASDRLARELRDVRWNPQRHLEGPAATDPRAADLATRKQVWIARPAADGRARFHALRDLTDQLQPFVAGQVSQLRAGLARARFEEEANAILRRRDYAFCLFPEELLREFCGRFQDRSS